MTVCVPQEEESGPQNQVVYTGRRVRRVVLVLDCVAPHNFSNQEQFPTGWIQDG